MATFKWRSPLGDCVHSGRGSDFFSSKYNIFSSLYPASQCSIPSHHLWLEFPISSRPISSRRLFFRASVHFTVTMSMEDLDTLEKGDGLFKYFKLESSVSTTNMVLFDQDGQLEK